MFASDFGRREGLLELRLVVAIRIQSFDEPCYAETELVGVFQGMENLFPQGLDATVPKEAFFPS